MDPQAMQPRAETSSQNLITPSEIFATVQQLSSQIDDSRVQHVVEAVKSLTPNDIQSIVDMLSIALEKYYHLLVHADRVSNLLAEIASSLNIMAHNRTLNTDQLTTGPSPDVYTVRGEPPTRLRVIKQDSPGVFCKALTTWAHLSHPNILPIYGAFLDGNGGPISLVSPVLGQSNIVDYAKTLVQAERMPLIFDVIDGLCYLHQLNIVHGSINPESALVSNNGRVFLTDLDGSSQTFAVRYLAPEVLDNDDTITTKSADIWALGCLFYEVLSGNIPYCQYRQEKVGTAVVTRKQPTRPGQQGFKGEVIDDVKWGPISACWEFDPEDRPSCLKLHDAFASINPDDDRPASPLSSTLERVQAPAIDLENIRSLLNRVLGSDQLLPAPSKIPDQLREPLFGLADNLPRAYSVAAAAKKFNPDDTQTLLDALDLLVEENRSFIIAWNPVIELTHTLMASTHILPQCYELRRIRYDPSPIVEDSFGKVFKGRDIDVCVNVVTNSSHVASILRRLAFWAHWSHPNILPFYGVFNEVVNGIPRFCVVSPFLKNGTLLEYAPRLPQKSRISLISDVLDALGYLSTTFIYLDLLRPDTVLISDDGRALVTTFSVTSIVTCTAAAKATRSSASRAVRFQAPEYYKTQEASFETAVWSFGCLCYEVLSGKPPYHQFVEKDDVESALARGVPPERPITTDNDIEIIDDQFWELIMGCCRSQPGDRLTVLDIHKLLANVRTQDERPKGQKLPSPAIVSLRKRPDIDWDRVKQLLGQIQVELLRIPLSKLIRNRIKDVAAEAVKLAPIDVQTLVDFLDVTLKDHLSISDERNRALALLSRVMASAQVFPQRHDVKGIKYDPKPIDEGGFGRVHRGSSNPTLCVKVTTRVNDPHALVAYIRELILWAHSSHPNILPFYGVYFKSARQMCLVSPYMTKGNLSDYAHQIPQSSRVPLLLDTVKGLDYLHGLGIVHTDLKGENVLISDEGRGLITDFGASHIITATAKGEVTTASVATTLRFTAPEIIQDETRRVRPSKECDIWSFGCLCYQILSRKLPYYEFRLEAQVFAAIFREQLPKQPGPTKNDTGSDSDDDVDDFDEKDWDDLDDTTWSLIMKCLVPKPAHRLSASQVEELIVDMKPWDRRPVAKGVPGPEILKQRPSVDVNLNRAAAIMDHLQILFLARSIYEYSDQDIVTAVRKLDKKDANNLQAFWASTLNKHLFLSSDRRRILVISSAVIAFRLWYPLGYNLETRPDYHPKPVGEGSFGKVYREPKLNICVKVAQYQSVDSRLWEQWPLTVAPWAHSSHPNILPFYGLFIKGGRFLVLPFIENGNMHGYTPGLPQTTRMLLISDVIEGLIYMHKLGVIHGNLKTQNVLISAEGRGLITDFRPYHVNVAAAEDGPTGSFITSTLRFTAPELVKNTQMLPTAASDVWSVGCLFYEVLSQKVPYYEYNKDSEIRTALFSDKLPTRPILSDGSADQIDDKSWDLIMQCCASQPESRPGLEDIQEWLGNMDLKDNRPTANPLPGAEILKEGTRYKDIDVIRFGEILDKLKTHLPTVTQERERDDEHQN